MADMRLMRLRLHRGPSLFSARRCCTLRIGGHAAPLPTDWAAGLRRHPALSFLDGAPPHAAASAITWLAIALQRGLGHTLPEPGTVGGLPRGIAVVPVWDAELGVLAARAAVDAVAAASTGRDPTVSLDRFVDRAEGRRYSESEIRLIAAAERRGIPWNRLIPGHRLLRLGEGAWQMRVQHTFTPRTSRIATFITTRKEMAGALMRAHGLPVPIGRRVGSADDAVRVATAIGYPVVVKPTATDYGIAVSLDLRSEADVRCAHAVAARYGPVLVEQQIAGDHTRLLVVHGRFVSAVRQDPAQVVGDGTRTVAALIAAVNAERTDDVSASFKRIAIDAEAELLLARQDLQPDSIPAAGRRVVLRHTSNTSRGGTARNVTSRVHPDNARLAERAAAAVGLDVAGIDFITPDIERSFRDVGGAICEVNATPGFFMREPGYLLEDTFLDGWFAAGEDGRVPIVCLLADAAAAAAAAADRIAHRLRAATPGIAVVGPQGGRIDDWALPGVEGTADATAMALADPATRVVVACLDRRGVAADGLGVAACALALIADGSGPEAALLARHAAQALAPADGSSIDRALDRIAAAAARPIAAGR